MTQAAEGQAVQEGKLRQRDCRPLTLTWVIPPPNLTGGIRAIRELSEAMERRGHRSLFVHPRIDKSWPPVWRPRRFYRRLSREVSLRGKVPHHLVGTKIPITSSAHDEVKSCDVPTADFLIATWWKTREWIDDFPEDRGIKAYFVQGYEAYSDDTDARVKRTYTAPSVKFAVAHWLKKKMADEFGDEEVAVIPNGFDRSLFSSPPRVKPSRPTVGFMYSDRPWKGAEMALRAIEILRQKVPDLRVVCFGDSPLSPQARAAKLEYFRAPAQTQIAELYRQASVWWVPSWREGFGLPGIEAAGCGAPVIATRAGGPEDYVRDGENGYLVDVEDAEDLARRSLEVLQCKEERWAQLSRDSLRIADEFDWDRSARLLEEHLSASKLALSL